MHNINLKEAESRLAELVEEVSSGEEVVIISNDGKCFKLVPFTPIKPTPKFGSAKGLIKISEDFDEPLEGFEEYVP